MVLNFKKPCIEDKNQIQKILETTENINSESTFGTSYLWSNVFNIEFCQIKNNKKNILFKKLKKENIVFEFPQGISSSHHLKEAMSYLTEYIRSTNIPNLKFTNLLGKEVSQIQKIFPGQFKITSDRNNYDYIYKSKDLALLKGKKYHSKKNHISKFSKLYNWNYYPLNSNEKESYSEFFHTWFQYKNLQNNVKNSGEYNAIEKALQNLEKLNLSGGVIKINNKIIACTIGEPINSKAFLIHFEKALPEYSLAYSVINNEFAKTIFENNYEFINREEDMGIPGLRKAKLSYKPYALIPKYDATLII